MTAKLGGPSHDPHLKQHITKPFSVRVVWNECDDVTYKFATEAERDAFCHALNEHSSYREHNSHYNDRVTVYIRKQKDDGSWGWYDDPDWLDDWTNFES
jgi:hypothetical protein